MVDVFSQKKRSEIMSRIKSRNNQATEIRLLKILKENRIYGWRRRSPLFGSPDFVFPAQRVAIFVDGCFWHGCQIHRSVPRTNITFWRTKINANKKRDQVVNKELRQLGWKVLRLWQHDLRNPQRVAKRILRELT